MKNPTNILLIRFSAMGDVVLTVPVIKSLLKKYPQTQITLLTNSFFHPFFNGIPNLTLFPVDLKGKHKGVKGLYSLVKEITAQQKFDTYLDLHSVLRSWIIGFFLRIKGISTYSINKGRSEKKLFVKEKKRAVLRHTTDRYLTAFKKAGYNFKLKKVFLTLVENKNFDTANHIKTETINIGVAPFAAHKSKEWGIKKFYELIEEINNNYSVNFYLFGGGESEIKQLKKLADTFQNVNNLAGRFSLQEELLLMKNLDVLIAMDSGNMHIASLIGIPVISIWGGTHPNIGFGVLYQSKENCVQISIDELPCRPCSVYGTSTCELEETPFACLNGIDTSEVIGKLKKLNILKKV